MRMFLLVKKVCNSGSYMKPNEKKFSDEGIFVDKNSFSKSERYCIIAVPSVLKSFAQFLSFSFSEKNVCKLIYHLSIAHDTQPAFIYLKLTIETLEQGVEICSKLKTNTPERRHWHISHLVLVFLLLTLNM